MSYNYDRIARRDFLPGPLSDMKKVLMELYSRGGEPFREYAPVALEKLWHIYDLLARGSLSHTGALSDMKKILMNSQSPEKLKGQGKKFWHIFDTLSSVSRDQE